MDISETTKFKKELAMIIEEFLIQRIEGMKNEQGVYVTMAFPKLLYMLCEENITEDAPYWYLTELSAKCTAKRVVPDYISKKKMQEYKIDRFGKGDSYPCMGCRSFLTPYRTNGNPAKSLNYVAPYETTDESNKKMWEDLLKEGKEVTGSKIFVNDGRTVKNAEGKNVEINYLEKLNDGTVKLVAGGVPVYYSRFNSGVVTISLPDLALSSGGNMKKFWELFEERTELCHRALQARLDSLKNASPAIAPILWKHGAFARLEDEDSIEPLLHDGFSTISLGYAGLYECVKYMTGKSHTDEAEGEAFGLMVMKALNDKCAQWKKAEDVDYSVYGTPIESTTYKFAKALKKRFGDDVFVKIDGKDRNYITNSYHVWVEEEIDPFEKLRIESKFQKLSPGGAISYIETANLQDNIPAVLEVIKYIYDTIMYAELNTKSDYCHVCGSTDEMEIIEDNGDLKYRCKHCGNTDSNKQSIARRVL
jgi:ribonucleoside-triphosphate reductase